MLYENYRRKILKVSDIINKIKRHLVLISTITAIVLLSVFGLLFAKGMIFSVDKLSNITYGQSYQGFAKAFMSSVSYEYKQEGGAEWHKGMPREVGTYRIRAVSTRVFGSAEYSHEQVTSILPKPINVYIQEGSIQYGDNPNITAALEFDDSIECSEFTFSGTDIGAASVAANPSAVVITDKLGNNNNKSYIVRAVPGDINIVKRQITIKFDDVSSVYDGKLVKAEGLSYPEKPLAYDDICVATDYPSLTNAGQIDNTANVKILNSLGENVTEKYIIKKVSGKINVEKRPLDIETASAEKIYDGTPLSNMSYTLSTDTPLVSGHSISTVYATEAVDVGSVSNSLGFKVMGGEADLTANYSFNLKAGSLNILPRAISLKTNSAQKSYDGTPLVSFGYTITSTIRLPVGHQLVVDYSGHQTIVGSSENTIDSIIVLNSEGADVTRNYALDCTYGTLTVQKRSIEVTTGSASLVYSGLQQSYEVCEVTSGFMPSGHYFEADPESLTYLTNVCPPVQNYFSVFVFNEFGQPVSDYFDITYKYGNIEMVPLWIYVYTGSEIFYYTGLPQCNTSFSTYPEIIQSQSAKIVTEPTYLTNVERLFDGSFRQYDNVFEIQIFEGEENVSYNYVINYIYGKIEMHPRPVTIITISREFIYDGTAQFDDSFTLYPDLLEGDEARVVSQATMLTEVEPSDYGFTYYDNIFSVSIFTGEEDTSHNYSIFYEYGQIVMKPRPITVTTGSKTFVYTGHPQCFAEFEITEGNLVLDHTAQARPDSLTYVTDVIKLGNGHFGSVPNEFIVDVYSNTPKFRSVSHNYDIQYIYGELTVVPVTITIITATSEWVYDGYEHSDASYQMTSGLLKEGHFLLITSQIPSITNVIRLSGGKIGSIKNEFYLGVFYYEGNDLLLQETNYEFEYHFGTLTINPRPITVKANNNSKAYDGTPLFCESFVVTSPLDIVFEQRGEATFGGSQTEIGSSECWIISFKVLLGYVDVTYNYDVTLVKGTLTVYKRSLIITADNASKEYDGTPLTCATYHYDGLLNGHYLSALTTGSRTEVGYSYNSIDKSSVKITDALYRDVSHLYDVYTANGELHVYERKITIKTYSAEKPYDGTPLTDDRYEIIGELAQGHQIYVHVTGYIIEVGSVLNSANIYIQDENYVDVAYRYSIERQIGILTITGDDNGGDNGGGGDGEFDLDLDGEIVTDPMIPADGKDVVVFRATSSHSGAVYFRIKSFGDYVVSGWSEANPYTLTGVNPLFFSTMSLYMSEYDVGNIAIQPVAKNLEYMIPYYAVDGYLSDNDVFIDYVPNDVYSFSYIPYEYNYKDNLSIANSGYEGFEAQYYQYVLNNYLYLPASTRNVMLQVARDNDLNADNASIIDDVKQFVQNKVKYSLQFNPYSGDIAEFFFTKAETGICQHYATAATAMLRALGIPARYTVGFVANMKAGSSVNVSPMQAHAWVEVYIKGVGWIQIEVTGQGDGSGAGIDFGGGGDGELIPKLAIKPVDVYKVYDGTILFPKNEVEGDDLDSILLLEDLLSSGYTYTAKVGGGRTELGVSDSTILDFVLYDNYGRNVTDAFEIVYKKGRIRIINAPININVYSLQKYYDGTQLSYQPDDYWIKSGLPDGYSLLFSMQGSMIDMGIMKLSYFEDLPYQVFDDLGNDVSSAYSLVFEGEPLRIDRRPIEITTNSEQKIYDGKPLKSEVAWISQGSLAIGQTLKLTFAGTITDIGKAPNKLKSLIITDASNKDTTKNYRIIINLGILEVEKNEL